MTILKCLEPSAVMGHNDAVHSINGPIDRGSYNGGYNFGKYSYEFCSTVKL